MIICRTPMRMSFVGGGSDMECFYRRCGGAVVSMAINKYMYINVNKKFTEGVRASYSCTEEVETASEVRHPLIRSALEVLGIASGVEIASMADVQKGTGLGSSSAFTVCLLHALSAFKGEPVSFEDLAQKACRVEIDMCNEPIGKQDQYAAAFGGLNHIVFHPNGRVSVNPIDCPPGVMEKFLNHILVFYTGASRGASSVLKSQQENIKNDTGTENHIADMAALCNPFIIALQGSNIARLGEIMHENWILKRKVANIITTDAIDAWYATAIDAGAIGGKLLGAGNGGFLMFLAPPERHSAIRSALRNLSHMPIGFEKHGSQIIYCDQ